MNTILCLIWILSHILDANSTPKWENISSPQSPELDLNYRLPENFIPIHYDLFIQTNLQNQDQNNGRVTVQLFCQQSSNQIHVHSVRHRILRISITCQIGSWIFVKGYKDHSGSSTIRIYLSDVVHVSDICTLDVSYNWEYSSDQLGPFKGKDADKYLLITQFQDIYARNLFLCLDEPSFKSTFQISVKLVGRDHLAYTILSNMPQDRVDYDLDSTTVHFQTTKLISTYVLGLIIAKYGDQGYTEIYEGARYTSWGMEIKSAKLLVNLAINTSRYMERNFKIASGVTKLDITKVDQHAAGSMEQWGIFPCNQRCFDSQSIIPHEMIHQWIGNLVTAKWWDDIWLNEGLTQFYTCHLTVNGIIEYDRSLEDAITCHLAEFQLAITALRSNDYALSDKNWYCGAKPAKWWTQGQVYHHGSAVIHMIISVMGEKWFQYAMSTWMRTYKYKVVTSEDFVQHLTTVVHNMNLPSWIPQRTLDFRPVLESWIYQKYIPIVHVIFNHGSKLLLLHQTCANVNTESCNFQWYLPIWYRSNFSPNSHLKWLIPGARTELPYPKGFLKINEHCQDVYLVNRTDITFMDIINGIYLTNGCDLIQFSELAMLENYSKMNGRKYFATICKIMNSENTDLWLILFRNLALNRPTKQQRERKSWKYLRYNTIHVLFKTMHKLQPLRRFRGSSFYLRLSNLFLMVKALHKNERMEIKEYFDQPFMRYLRRKNYL